MHLPAVRPAASSAPSQRLEGMVNTFILEPEHGSMPKLPGNAPNDGNPPTAEAGFHTEASQSKREAKEGYQPAGFLVSGEDGKLYVDGEFWSTIRQEVRTIREAFEAEEGDDEQTNPLPLHSMASRSTSSLKGSSSNHSTWIFQSPYSFGVTNIGDLLPMPSQMLFTWQAYIENIDPFLKIVHVPTITEAINSSKCRLADMDPAMCALLSCICFAAITSLTEEEVLLNYNVDKTTLSLRFRAGAESALARADFMNTASLTTIQAFTIFLSVLHCEESTRFVWSLTGTLIRLAVSLGLHMDGLQLKGISPFEIEMRRRVWWHICFLDSRTGDNQVHDAQIPETLFSTKPPSNVNDKDMNHLMTEPVIPREGPTDMSICLVRCRVWQVIRAMCDSGQHAGTDDTADGRSKLESSLNIVRAFRESLLSPPSAAWSENLERDWFLRMMTEVVASRLELMAKYQDLVVRNLDPTFQTDLFNLAVKVVDLAHKLRKSPSMSKWAWLSHGFFQWQPLIIVLSHICAVPWEATSEKAWTIVRETIGTMSLAIKHEPLWQPLQRMLSRAQRHRALSMELAPPTATITSVPDPEITASYCPQELSVASNTSHIEGWPDEWTFNIEDTSSSGNPTGDGFMNLDSLADEKWADLAQWINW
ncbi:hypothetical protein FANTH_13127 [Fusarium anthophilum]|uniref:Xylanolytic transcriptional activator regulatory domain-containing protein n=1 Tax=Fusarium anthophilum TaxID=48485 RepID=A0A8H5DQN3_9HYPO|nr:hypothetical protein FANTH_13127 [Fusarium anthophilum]